jgi:hypothetical protein
MVPLFVALQHKILGNFYVKNEKQIKNPWVLKKIIANWVKIFLFYFYVDGIIIVPKSLFKHYRNYICAVCRCEAEKFSNVTSCGQIYKMICINFSWPIHALSWALRLSRLQSLKLPLKSNSSLFTLTLYFEHNLLYQNQFMMAEIFNSVRLSCFQPHDW